MDENDLKRYTVILGGGSGVLFQPLDETKTYILTAKHVLYKDIEDERGRKTKELISKINFSYSNDQSNLIEFEIAKGQNYFEHDSADAAILVLEENLGFNQIFIDERTTGFDSFNLTGYPNCKRNADDKYDKLIISDLNSYNDSLITLRLVVNHLEHEQITGFSGGGIIKINGDSLLLAGIQSETPNGPCNGEIQVVPIKRFEEIVDSNNLSQLLPGYLSKIAELIDVIIRLDDTNVELKPKLKTIIKRQLNQVKLNLINIYQSNYIEKSCVSKLNKKTKHFWTSFLEYALIISLIEDNALDEDSLMRIIKEKKFVFSDSDKGIYEMFSDILLFASDDTEGECLVLVGSLKVPSTKKTRRISTKDITKNIGSVNEADYIDRVDNVNRIKELIHLKAIELDCVNENEDSLNMFNIGQLDELLNELKRIVNEFFGK
ncbi:hypothetical protein D0T49_02350 [Paludibacter sp. 221]|uniref:ABC-three component system protein n=1 Tax=Paludibacter sp. 221 TaxID=2302939 RepID=UPI0013D0D661|nr:ABC-three component system protein [Paludibacter sp. 221]NDV45891.1 hypothetical protein [Paludibacter sp. 221]